MFWEGLQTQLLREMLKELEKQTKLLECIKRCVCLPPKSATGWLTITTKGNPDMPLQVPIGQAGIVFVFTEWSGPNGSGDPVPDAGTINYASDNAAVATVDASGNVTALAAGTANIAGIDSVNGLTASDMLTVTSTTPPPAVSATGVLTLATALPPGVQAAIKSMVKKVVGK